MKSEEENEDHQLSRRELIKLGAGAALGAPLVGIESTHQAKPAAPRFFTAEEYALVDELTELIIPTDEHSPGARAAGVARYIDFRLSEEPEAAVRKMWKDGLRLVDGLSREINAQPFLKATPAGRLGVLARMARGEAKPEREEELFFRELKSRTAHAYYTSKIGLHDELGYLGNTYLREFAGEDVSK
jgi:hypothetical protein